MASRPTRLSGREGKKRPTEFKSAAGSETFVASHKRVKK
jgi:hypothetical protein